MRPTQLLAGVLAVSSLASAWSWDDAVGGKGVQAFEGMLFGRQEGNNKQTSSSKNSGKSSSGSASASASASASDSKSGSGSGSGSGTAQKTGSDSKSGTGTAKETGKTTGTATGTDGSSGTATANHTTYDARLPAGGVSMVTPAATSTTFLKIGNWWTFAWNYTSLSSTPSRIDVLASCSAKETAWPIAMNMTVQHGDGGVQKVLWDTDKVAEELVMETYTLLIYDASQPDGVSATVGAGYFAPQSTYTFAVYEGQSYTPRDQWQCIACSPGNKLSASEKQTIFFLFSMAGVTILSFTWFASGVFGVF